jgi:hypothetical protein
MTDFVGCWADMTAFILEMDIDAHYVFSGRVVLRVSAYSSR